MSTVKHNLKSLLTQLLDENRNISALYLFGSRAYKTGSTRSDCDMLVKVEEGDHIKAHRLRDFAIERCAALDFFIATNGRATSCMNDSFVYADTFEELAQRLDAIELWNKEDGFLSPPVEWVFETNAAVEFPATNMPNAYLSELSWHTIIKRAEELELPTCPYIGDTIDKATALITDVAKRMVLKSNELAQRGNAVNGWTVNLESEYDCQNLFYTVVKPWIPGIAREPFMVTYDKQEKSADFSLFGNKLIVEFKFIDSDNKKREVLKQLDGLSRFYSLNANVRILLLLIFVKEGLSFDDYKIAADHTLYHSSPKCITHVIRVP